MHPYSLICDDVITFCFFLKVIPLHQIDKRSVYLISAFDHWLSIDKLTINVCQILVHQMFFAKCWPVHPSDKICPNKMASSHNIAITSNWNIHLSMQHTIQELLNSVTLIYFKRRIVYHVIALIYGRYDVI